MALLLSFLHHADEVVSLLSSLARTVVQSISNQFGLGTKPGTSTDGTERDCNSVHALDRRNLNGTAVPGVPGTGDLN